MAVVIGIDPGSRFCGFGLIDIKNDELKYLAHGVIAIPQQLSFAEKLNHLAGELRKIYDQYSPEQTVVEKIFFGKNIDSAFKLGHVRGVCLYLAAKAKNEVYEYAARTVKKAVTGTGAASKDHVALVVTQVLKISNTAGRDATDALALGICHGQQLQIMACQQRLREGVNL